MKENNAKRIIMDQLITPYLEKNSKYVGTEIETVFYPVNSLEAPKDVMCEAFEYMVKEHGFSNVITGSDGYVVRIDNGIDSISADYSYVILEFSMGKSKCINEIGERFYKYYKVLTAFFDRKGYSFTGFGCNLFYRPFQDETQYTHDPFYSKIREYVLEHTAHKDISCFYTLMASTQSHLDIRGEKFLKTFNLFNKLEFVRGLLFANSIPNTSFEQKHIKYPDNLLCARDFLWENQGLPNTGVIEKDFESIDELAEHYSKLKVFVRMGENGLSTFEPMTLEEYFEKEDRLTDGLSCFRSFEHVVLNNYHALEVRSDCTQPMADVFSPLAFNLGISEMVDEVMETVNKFLHDNQIELDNAKLRYMAITGQEITEPGKMQAFLGQLYEHARTGLVRRGYGEEIYIECIKERIESGILSPAQNMKKMLEEGKSILEVAEIYAQIK